MVKKILLESPFLTLSSSNNLLSRPPAGYRFVEAGELHSSEQEFFKKAGSLGLIRGLFLKADGVIPMTLLRSSLLQRRARVPGDIAFTFAIQHLVFRREPWVVPGPLRRP